MYYHSINGQQSETLSISNRGLAYGDGVFTTAKVFNGEIQFVSAHMKRLIHSCDKLNIALPDMDLVTDELMSVALRFPLSVVKIIITAGDGGRGYSRAGCLSSSVIITFHAFPEHYTTWQKHGICLGLSALRLGISPLTSGIKHLNRLEQVLVRQELDNRDEDDLLVLNYFENIIEASAANVFWLKDNIWYTPELNESGVAGLMRAHILQVMSNHDLKTEIVKAKLPELENIDAMFICNSIMGIVPVKEFQNKKFNLAHSHALTSLSQDFM